MTTKREAKRVRAWLVLFELTRKPRHVEMKKSLANLYGDNGWPVVPCTITYTPPRPAARRKGGR